MKELDPSKTYLITGGAGFIGFHLSRSLLERGAQVVGFDNMNDYYDVKLKEDRLAILDSYDKYSFIRGDLADNADVFRVFQEYRP
ncbi:MAG: GDP-mannose 4,6-dehydratase, partial [Lachnospiraceae bacterium]|nr:GDP-mannose 4,6-dehydratase [Lachnospiraceae bacterium]